MEGGGIKWLLDVASPSLSILWAPREALQLMPFQRACWSWIFIRPACCLPCWLSCVGGLFVDGGFLFCPKVWVLQPLKKQAAHFGSSSFSMSGEKLYSFSLEWLVMGLLNCCYNQLGEKEIFFLMLQWFFSHQNLLSVQVLIALNLSSSLESVTSF